ncbi:MAG: hypothetical protein ACI9MR_000004 [Myxococcota bacterium]|jgi:hypothetical protein
MSCFDIARGEAGTLTVTTSGVDLTTVGEIVFAVKAATKGKAVGPFVMTKTVGSGIVTDSATVCTVTITAADTLLLSARPHLYDVWTESPYHRLIRAQSITVEQGVYTPVPA